MRWARFPQSTKEKEIMLTIKDIPTYTLNSEIERCIDEYVRLIRDRSILRESWFEGLSYERIAEKHELSVKSVQNIIYKQGDTVLIKATENCLKTS